MSLITQGLNYDQPFLGSCRNVQLIEQIELGAYRGQLFRCICVLGLIKLGVSEAIAAVMALCLYCAEESRATVAKTQAALRLPYRWCRYYKLRTG